VPLREIKGQLPVSANWLPFRATKSGGPRFPGEDRLSSGGVQKVAVQKDYEHDGSMNRLDSELSPSTSEMGGKS
jgi:hypothetical protein